MQLRRVVDANATRLMYLAAIVMVGVVVLMGAGLLWRAFPLLQAHSFGDLFLSTAWRPTREEFGFYAYIIGTVYVTVIAGVIAFPVSIFTAIYLAEYAPDRVRSTVKPVLDVLAGIPSVVYGVWGLAVLVFGGLQIGFNILTAGIVLAVMVVPFMTSIAEESFRTVPRDVKEASLALGATRWEMVKHVVVRSSVLGVMAAAVLGFSRAFGETLAVMMVVGNVPRVPRSLMDPAATLPALIANNYGEMSSVPLYESALMLAALILFVVVVAFNILARWGLKRLQRRWA